MRATWLLLLVLLVGCAAPAPLERAAGPLGRAEGEWGQQDHFLPVRESGGGARLILARLCRPPGEGRHRLVVINHGKSPFAAQRAALQPASCGAEHVRWFLERGFAVLLPVRRGYGESGGAMAEAYPACSAPRDYAAGALEAARDIRAAIDYGTGLPGVQADRVVVVGQSAGGLGTIALSSTNDARVAALVNMAGGDGGRLNQVANNVCQPDALVAAMARFGASARAPMLWVYTANDSYFGPDLAASMHRAYVAAGGRAELLALPGWGLDGHILFGARGGSAVWGKPVERFLGLPPRVAAVSVLARPQ
jgi:dienelactone hydrolase